MRPEMKKNYSIVTSRTSADCDWIVEIIELETLFGTWSDCVKYARHKYGSNNISLNKRAYQISVRA